LRSRKIREHRLRSWEHQCQ